LLRRERQRKEIRRRLSEAQARLSVFTFNERHEAVLQIGARSHDLADIAADIRCDAQARPDVDVGTLGAGNIGIFELTPRRHARCVA
jgi:hypothetical protein